MHREKSEFSCPSAQPDMEDARVFGVIGGTADEPRVAYLKEEAVVDPVVFGEIGGLEPTHVFRFAAKCEEHRCGHFNGQRCTLAQRVIEKLNPGGQFFTAVFNSPHMPLVRGKWPEGVPSLSSGRY